MTAPPLLHSLQCKVLMPSWIVMDTKSLAPTSNDAVSLFVSPMGISITGNGQGRQNICFNIVGCSLMWLMLLRSLSNCDYELKKLPRLILGPIHSNQVMGMDPVGSHHGTGNYRSNFINPTYPYQSHD